LQFDWDIKNKVPVASNKSNNGQDQTTALIEGLQHLDVGVTVFTSDFLLVASNRRFQELLAFPDELCCPGVHLSEFFRFNAKRGEYGPGDIETQIEARMAIARRGAPYRAERIRPDGTVLEVSGSTLPSGGLVTVYADITERYRRAEELEKIVAKRTAELEKSRAELAKKSHAMETIIEHVRHGITMFDSDLNLVLCNNQFLDILRMNREFGRPGTPFEAFMRVNAERGEYGPGDIDELVKERVKMARNMSGHRFERVRPDGSAVEVIGSPIPDGGFVTTYTDITEMRDIREKLSQMAHHDSLTGLANRRLFHDSLDLALARARRRTRYGALLYCDLDGFKPINDRFGHECGDLVLKEVAERLRDCVRRSDLPARLGGDEFAIVVEDLNTPDEALEIGEKIIAAISQPILIYEMKVNVGCSIGIAIFDGSEESAERLINKADKSMYEAKQAGKGCIRVAKTD
jgi:diguanylate cyclase (GGDEF)-like protein